MNTTDRQPKNPIRIIVFIISAAFIIFMFVKKDVAAIYTSAPAEQVIPLVATTIAVSLVKVTVIAGGILLLKKIIGKFMKK